MEPEEYETYLKQQEEKQEKLKAYYESLKKDNSNLKGPTLYELNKQIIAQMPILNEDEIRRCSDTLLKYFVKNSDSYYMLLCNELNYYTVFHIISTKTTAMQDLITEFLDIVINLGDVRLIEEDNNGVLAVWSSLKPFNYDMLSDEAKEEVNKVHCFYLFPYGKGVIEI